MASTRSPPGPTANTSETSGACSSGSKTTILAFSMPTGSKTATSTSSRTASSTAMTCDATRAATPSPPMRTSRTSGATCGRRETQTGLRLTSTTTSGTPTMPWSRGSATMTSDRPTRTPRTGPGISSRMTGGPTAGSGRCHGIPMQAGDPTGTAGWTIPRMRSSAVAGSRNTNRNTVTSCASSGTSSGPRMFSTR